MKLDYQLPQRTFTKNSFDIEKILINFSSGMILRTIDP